MNIVSVLKILPKQKYEIDLNTIDDPVRYAINKSKNHPISNIMKAL